MRHVHALGALTVLSLACGGLPLPGAEPPPPPDLPGDEPEVPLPPCEAPSCGKVGPELQVRSEDGKLAVFWQGQRTGERYEDGLVTPVELDRDGRRELLVSRDCGGNGCLPDWFVIDCEAPGGRCVEFPLVEQVPEVRVAHGSTGHHQAWALDHGAIRCFELVGRRPAPCAGWTNDGARARHTLETTQEPGPDNDGRVVASLDADLDGDGRAEHVACSWWDRWRLLNCTTTLHGVEIALPSAARVEFLETATEGVLDVRANGLTGRWDGAGWTFPW